MTRGKALAKVSADSRGTPAASRTAICTAVHAAVATTSSQPHRPDISGACAGSSGTAVGTQPETVVPRPGAEITVSRPPAPAIRSARLTVPEPVGALAGSKPRPSSDTSKLSPLSVSARVTTMRCAAACLTAFCSASRQPKYAARSAAAGQRRRTSACTVTGTGLAVAAARSAAAGPESVSTAGYRPTDSRSRVCTASSRADRTVWAVACARGGSLVTSTFSSRRLTASATRCCWAPSWMSRSSRRRSSSSATRTRLRDSTRSRFRWSAAVTRDCRVWSNRVLSTRRPASSAASSSSRCSTGVAGRGGSG